MDLSFNGSDVGDYMQKLNNLIKAVESTLRDCNRKYKNKQEIDSLYASLTNFLSKENLNDSKFIDELTFIDKDFKKFINLNDANRKKILEYKERLKNLNTEVKSMKTMLEKSSNSWHKYNEAYGILNNWLDNQKNISDISNVDFSNYQKYQKLHSQFNECANFLIQVSDPFSSSKIKENLLFINKFWKSYQDKFKDTIYEQYLKFYECEHSLNMVNDRLVKIEHLLNRNVKISSTNKYQEELQKSSKDLEFLETNLKLVSKLSQRIDLKREKEKINNFADTVRSSDEKINQIKASVLEYQKTISQIQPDINSIVEGLENFEFWIIEGENLVRHEPDQFNFDEILLHIEKQKKHFDEFRIHNNSIKNKLNQLQSLKSKVPQNIDTNELNNKLVKLKDLIANLNTKRLKWEELFKEQQSLWRNFHSKTKQLEGWIANAQRIVIEKNDDFNFLIQKHREFFDNINEGILSDFLKSGEKLFCLKNDKDKLEIKNLMETLEGQWKMIISHAPTRLLKLEFKNLELLLKQELSEADKELNQHFSALAANHNAEKIYKKFHEKFKTSNFFPLCESYLEQMKKCVLELAENKIEDRSFIEDAFQHLNSQWISLTQKIERLSNEIQARLNKREVIDRNLTVLDSWLFELETTTKNLFDYNLPSVSEYSRTLEKMEILLQDLNAHRKLLNSIVAELKSLSQESSYLNETTSGFVDNLRSRFDKFVNENLQNIQHRSSYLRAVLQLAQKLDTTSAKIRSLSCLSTRRFMAEEDDSSLHSAVEEQKSVLDQMRMYEQEVDELKLEAKSLTSHDHLQMPTVVYERLNCVQETIRHNISEELERRSSLLEIRQLNDLKENKLQMMEQNLKIVEKLISLKSVHKTNEDSFTSFFDSNLNESLDESNDENNVDYFLKKISKCKDLLAKNSLILDDLNKTIGQVDSGDDRLDQLTFCMKRYHYQMDQVVDFYERGLAEQASVEKKLQSFKNELTQILKNFDCYCEPGDELVGFNGDSKAVFDFLSVQHEKIMSDIEQLECLKIDANKFVSQMNELDGPQKFNGDNHLPILLANFTHLLEHENLCKENELKMQIKQFVTDLGLVDDNYRNKCSQIRFKLNQHSLTKKQKKLDHLTNTLELQLDTLIGLSKEKESLIDVSDEEFDDLRKESENILLERMSLDDTQSTPNQSKKDLVLLQETTTRQIVKTIENVIKDDHVYEVYKVLPVNASDQDHFEETTVDYMIESDERMINQYDESILIEPEAENLRAERERLQSQREEFERSIVERHKYEQEIVERENVLRYEREKLEMEKSQLEQSRVELENKERAERERNESLRCQRERLEQERLQIERQEQEKIKAIERMIKLERENLEREKQLLEQSKYEKEQAERAERERLEQESEEVKRVLKMERQKLEDEKKELQKQRLAKEQEQQELERIRQERLEINRTVELERSRIEQERCELEKKAMIEQSERERMDAERKALECQAIEREKVEIEKRRLEIEALEKQRLELERLAALERNKIERERVERERLEKERLDMEKKRIEAECVQEQRMELERRAEVERERLEREKLDFEREKLEIERRRVQKEKLERERFELEEIYRIEQERLEKEKVELERQRREKELLEKEKGDLERQRVERQKLHNERKELEMQYKAEKERIEQERLGLESLEQERLELKRQEIERIKMIENEREQKLRQERVRIERIRTEREQKERLDAQRRQSQREEAEKILELKRKEREEAEACAKLERERQAEIERIENQMRRDKLQKLEQERLRNQQKFQLELHLKEMCERLNLLKSKIVDLQIDQNSVEQIQQFEIEINKLDDQVLELYNRSISLENRMISGESADYYLFDTLDHAALTQFDLLRSFLAYLKAQIEHKKNEVLRKSDLKIKLANLKENLDRYMGLADKINSCWSEHQAQFCVESQADLEKRIESMDTIESSIDACFRQISELSKEFKNDSLIDDLANNRLDIERNTIQPLLMNLSKAKHFLNQWKLFDERFDSFTSYLYEHCEFEQLSEAMRQDSILFELNSQCASLESDLEKYSSLRSVMVKKLAESDELLVLGANLFDLSQSPPVVCPDANKKFIQMKTLVNDVSKFLDEKCCILRFAIKENKKFEFISAEFAKLKDEIEALMSCSGSNLDVNVYKQNFEKISQIKKQLRDLVEEKEKEEQFDNHDISYSQSRFQSLKKKVNPCLKLDLENTIHYLTDTIQFLEVDYHQNIMKNLPSRNSLNDLQHWLEDAYERIRRINLSIESDRPVSLKKLESIRKEINQLRDQLVNEKEIEFKFCSEIIENEAKQGFFDLNIQETSVQVGIDLQKLKQKVNSSLERVQICVLKLDEFCRSIGQIKSWLDNKSQQAQLEKVTKFKTDFDESTILMDQMQNLTSLQEEKNLVKQIVGLHKELDEIRKFWLDDKILNDPLIHSVIFDYIIQQMDDLKTNLDKVELFNHVKIQNNFTNMKQSFSAEINELNLRLQNELNFILSGKMTSLAQYTSSIANLKQTLHHLDLKRSDMEKHLKQFELDLQSSDLPLILNVSNNSSLLLDPHLKHSILNNLTNRDLENKAKSVIYQAEMDMVEQWKKYDQMLENLLTRLQSNWQNFSHQVNSIECTCSSESVGQKRSLFEQTLAELNKSKSIFSSLEQVGLTLCPLNENVAAQILQNNSLVEIKLAELSKLADSVSQRLEQAGQEQKMYAKLVDEVERVVAKSKKILEDESSEHLENCLSADIKKLSYDIESVENELRGKMSEFKNVHVKDSECIEKIYCLTSQCSTQLNNLRDFRIKLLDQIQERNYLTEVKLNDLHSFLNSVENFVENKFGQVGEQVSLLEQYVNCVKYLQTNDLELSKWQFCLEHLQIEIDQSSHKQKICSLSERIQKLRLLVRQLSSKDGLFEQLLALKDLCSVVESADFKLSSDEAKLVNLKQDFINLTLKIEQSITQCQIVDFDFFNQNCLKNIETKLNASICTFLQINDLSKQFSTKLNKINDTLDQIEAKLSAESTQFIRDLSGYEQKLANLKSLKSALTNTELRSEIEHTQHLSERLQTTHQFQATKIKYLDMCCDLDKLINKHDLEHDHLRQIVTKSQQLLDLIKQSHEQLSQFKINKSEERIESELSIDQMLNFMKLNVLQRLKQNELIKNDILDLYSGYLTTSTRDNTNDLIKEIVDKLLFEWDSINERCFGKIKKFEVFKTKLTDVDRRLNKIREYLQSMESYVRYEMFAGFDLTDMRQIVAKKAELENLLSCLDKKDAGTDAVLKQALSMYRANVQQMAFVTNLKTRWDDLKIVIRDKILKLSNIWLFLNDQIENFYVILNKTEDFYTNILLNANYLIIDECEIKNFELSKYTGFFRLIEDLYATINEDNKLIKYLNESFINFSKYVHDFESSQCLEKIRHKLIDINARWDALHNDIAIKIRLARKYQSELRDIIDLPFNENLLIWVNEMNLLITNLEHLSAKELLAKVNEIEDIKREICDQTNLVFKNDYNLIIESNLIDQMKDLMRRIIRIDSFIQQSTLTNLTRTYSGASNQTSEMTSLYGENFNYKF